MSLVSFATSIYQEDSVTATQLMNETAKKTREIMQAVEDLATMVESIALKVGYSEEEAELQLTIAEKLTTIKEEATACYNSVYHEDAMTAIELAGCTAKHVNECIRIVNMLADTITQLYTLGYNETDKEIVIGG